MEVIVQLNMDGQISKKIFQKISNDNVKIKPRCIFTAISLLWKLLALALIVIGALIFNFLLYSLSKPIDNFFVLYLLMVVLMAYLAAQSYKSSCLCCKTENCKLFMMSFVLTIALAAAIHSFHFGQDFHDKIESKVEQRKVIILP